MSGQVQEDIAAEETALVERAQAERAAFEPLYRRYADPVYRYCYRRLGDPEAAADATGQVFARALAGLAGFRGGSFRAWLFTIAHNVVLDELRRSHSDLPLSAASEVRDPEPAHAPELEALANVERRALIEALETLPEDQRRIVELRLAGLKGPEIAAVLRRSHSAIKSSQFRAYARLREVLGVERVLNEGTNHEA